MGVHWGGFSVINGMSTMRNWSANVNNEAREAVASNTKGGKKRIKAIHDWSGNMAAYGVLPHAWPGDVITFEGHISPDNDVEGAVGSRLSGPAIVDSVVLTWDWANDALFHVINFSGDGPALFEAAAAAYSDATAPAVPPACRTKLTYEDTGEQEWTNLVTAVLTISAANQAYVNSSTVFETPAGGGIFECWRRRNKGVIDWTLAVTEQNHEQSAVLSQGADLEIKLYDDSPPTTFYHLKWCHVQNYSGINVDRESGAILQRTVNMGMNGWNPTVGFLKRPDTTSFWP